MAHRSPSPFSTGVPVRASLRVAGMAIKARAASLAGFLIAWASSATNLDQVTPASAWASRTAVL